MKKIFQIFRPSSSITKLLVTLLILKTTVTVSSPTCCVIITPYFQSIVLNLKTISDIIGCSFVVKERTPRDFCKIKAEEKILKGFQLVVEQSGAECDFVCTNCKNKNALDYGISDYGASDNDTAYDELEKKQRVLVELKDRIESIRMAYDDLNLGNQIWNITSNDGQIKGTPVP